MSFGNVIYQSVLTICGTLARTYAALIVISNTRRSSAID
jgi:hypothetical protein